MSYFETRVYTGEVAYRAAAEDSDGPGVLAGYAAVYNKRSRDLGGFIEQIASTAFAKSLKDGADVVARYNHRDEGLLGRVSSGTLRLGGSIAGHDVKVGLPYEVDLPDTTTGRDLAVLAKRGDVYQSSFAFQTVKDQWDETDDGYPLRTLVEVKLIDVAPVNDPAYPDATVGIRSLADHLGTDVDTIREAVERGCMLDLIRELPRSDAGAAAADEDETREDDGPGRTHPQPSGSNEKQTLRLRELHQAEAG